MTEQVSGPQGSKIAGRHMVMAPYLYWVLEFWEQFHRTWQLECLAFSVLDKNTMTSDYGTVHRKSRRKRSYRKDSRYSHYTSQITSMTLRELNNVTWEFARLRSDISSRFNSHHELELWGETRNSRLRSWGWIQKYWRWYQTHWSVLIGQ